MKKVTILAVLALSLTGCGSIPGLSLFGAQESETSTAQQSFYSIMGVEGEDVATQTASSSAGPAGRANLGQLLFDLLDTNADGAIAADEFSAAVRLRRASATDSQISELFAQLDRDDDNTVTLDELQPRPRMKGGKERGGRGGRGGRMERSRHQQFGPPPGGAAPEEGEADRLAPEADAEPQV